MGKEAVINNLIRKEQVDTNLISDGFHTFGELYEHRHQLFIALARIIQDRTLKAVWRYKSDPDFFILGINQHAGHQITYHIPMQKWNETNFAYTLSEKEKPVFDGHTSNDVLQRLKKIQ